MATITTPNYQSDEAIASLSEDDKIILEARERFKRAWEWESEFRKKYLEDVKFSNGDPDNGWQWPDALRKDREANQRPSLTINKTQQHVLRITNMGRKNPPAVKIKPTGGSGTYKAAQAWEGLIRNIEYESAAQVIYVNAQESQVEGGIGWWRVTHDYVDDHSFDQKIMIDPIVDQLSVLLDCDIKQKDGSDAKWGFAYEDIYKKEFKKEYPKVDIEPANASFSLTEEDVWITDDKIRVAEYYRLVRSKDELIYLEIPGSEPAEFYRSEVPEKLRKQLEEAEDNKSNLVRTRKVTRRKLQWFKIAGREIVERRDLKGSYIPLIRVVGREKRIDGKLERKGLVRTLKDAQRMYNFNTSQQVETAALQTKTPWILPAAAVEGNQGAWHNANRSNAAYLTYKHKDDSGQPLPPPQRVESAKSSQAAMDGMRIASAEMEMASGQYAPQQENPLLERSPAAISERKQVGETATFDFVDNLGLAVRYTATVILDLAPHIYDTERVIKILEPDGTQRDIRIDPKATDAYQENQPNGSGDNDVSAIFNPSVGRYQVQAALGPAYGTQREEAWDTFERIFTKQPELMNIFGDIAFSSADFHQADKIAERLKRQIASTAPWLLDDNAETPMIAQLKAELGKQQTYVGELLQKLAEKEIDIKGKDEMRDIDAYEAATKRLTAQGNVVEDFAHLDPKIQDALQRTVMQTLKELGVNLDDVLAANKPVLDSDAEGKNGNPEGYGGISAYAPGGVPPP